MLNTIEITSNLRVGPQPGKSDLEHLAKEGYGSIVNLRVKSEEGELFPPEEEAEMVRSLDMEYLHIPVSGSQLRADQVDTFRQCVEALPKPIFVHCAKGKRAGALSMMYHAVSRGMSGEETLKAAKEKGFECDQPALAQFVKDYVDERTK